MNISRISFWFFILFLFGIALFGFGVSSQLVLVLDVISALILVFLSIYLGRKELLIFSILIFSTFVGFSYYNIWYNHHYINNGITYNEVGNIYGKVISDSTSVSSYQRVDIKNHSGFILQVNLRSYKKIEYGDNIVLSGTIKHISKDYHYLIAKNAVGVIRYPKLISITRKSGFSLKKSLYNLRDRFVDVFSKTLSSKNATLMSGVLLGKDSAGFSREFTNSMKHSGTTHIVALSGYNVMILADMIFLLLSFFLSKKFGAPLAIFAIFLFVLMTGAEASAVRAAIMGSLVISAGIFSRIYNFAHSSIATAFVMVVFNPAILNFDVGFLLSFSALFGIIYLPQLFPKIKHSDSILGKITDIFYVTLSAQIMVLPILAISFGRISIVSLISNVLVLPIIPIIMGFGFISGFLGMIWMQFSYVVSIFLYPMLSYVVKVIELFGSFPILNVSLGVLFAIIYYIIIVVILLRFKSKTKEYEYPV